MAGSSDCGPLEMVAAGCHWLGQNITTVVVVGCKRLWQDYVVVAERKCLKRDVSGCYRIK